MKRLVLIAVALVFGWFIFVVSVLVETQGGLAFARSSFAAVDLNLESSDSAIPALSQHEQTGGVTSLPVSDYYLPYPGILPDHPLYWVKMVRDRVQLWLTRDEEARFERLLLYADKRIYAAKVLAEGNQPELAVSTATKAEKYLDQVAVAYFRMAESGKDVRADGVRLERAQRKHYEVLKTIVPQVPVTLRLALVQVQTMIEQSWRRVRQSLGMEVTVPEVVIIESDEVSATEPAELR